MFRPTREPPKLLLATVLSVADTGPKAVELNRGIAGRSKVFSFVRVMGRLILGLACSWSFGRVCEGRVALCTAYHDIV